MSPRTRTCWRGWPPSPSGSGRPTWSSPRPGGTAYPRPGRTPPCAPPCSVTGRTARSGRRSWPGPPRPTRSAGWPPCTRRSRPSRPADGSRWPCSRSAPSAGLCLYPDRYLIRWNPRRQHAETAPAGPLLECASTGEVPQWALSTRCLARWHRPVTRRRHRRRRGGLAGDAGLARAGRAARAASGRRAVARDRPAAARAAATCSMALPALIEQAPPARNPWWSSTQRRDRLPHGARPGPLRHDDGRPGGRRPLPLGQQRGSRACCPTSYRPESTVPAGPYFVLGSTAAASPSTHGHGATLDWL